MKNLLFKWQKSHNQIPCTLFYAHKYRPTLSISVIKSFNICFEPIFHSYHKYRSKGCKIITTKTKNCINSEFSSTIKIHSFSNICWYIKDLRTFLRTLLLCVVTSLGWDKGIFGICTFHIIPFIAQKQEVIHAFKNGHTNSKQFWQFPFYDFQIVILDFS